MPAVGPTHLSLSAKPHSSAALSRIFEPLFFFFQRALKGGGWEPLTTCVNTEILGYAEMSLTLVSLCWFLDRHTAKDEIKRVETSRFAKYLYRGPNTSLSELKTDKTILIKFQMQKKKNWFGFICFFFFEESLNVFVCGFPRSRVSSICNNGQQSQVSAAVMISHSSFFILFFPKRKCVWWIWSRVLCDTKNCLDI